MKKHLFLLLVAMMSLQACADKKQVITFAQLPQKAQTFVTTYFDQQSIAFVMQETDFITKDYDVQLQNGTKISFHKDGTLDNVETKPNPMPEGIVPAIVMNYVKATFPQAFVVEYNVDTRKQTVELNNGLELTFSLQGQFLEIDD